MTTYSDAISWSITDGGSLVGDGEDEARNVAGKRVKERTGTQARGSSLLCITA